MMPRTVGWISAAHPPEYKSKSIYLAIACETPSPSRGGQGWGWGKAENSGCQHPYLHDVFGFVRLEKSGIVEVDGGQDLENQRTQARDFLARLTARGGCTPSPPQPSP
ncbi:MAG: hypothetical protein WAO71_15035 [Gallionella sp.]